MVAMAANSRAAAAIASARVRRCHHPRRHGGQPRRTHPRQDRPVAQGGRLRGPGSRRQPRVARVHHRPGGHRRRWRPRRRRRSADPDRSRRAAHPRRRIGLGARVPSTTRTARRIRTAAGARWRASRSVWPAAGLDALVGHEMEFVLVGPGRRAAALGPRGRSTAWPESSSSRGSSAT